jgi:hypothetical protein
LRVAELAAMAYELVLQLLDRLSPQTGETGQQLPVLIGAAIDMMAGVLRPLAAALTALPAGPPAWGRHPCGSQMASLRAGPSMVSGTRRRILLPTLTRSGLPYMVTGSNGWRL